MNLLNRYYLKTMLHKNYTVSDFNIAAHYTLRIKFNGDSEQVINLFPMLRSELYGPLQNLSFFNQGRLDAESGVLVWPNEADFDPATLHDWDKVGDAMIEMARSWPDANEIALKKTKKRDGARKIKSSKKVGSRHRAAN